MSISDLKQKISELKIAITQQHDALGLLRQQITDAVKPFVNEQIKIEVEKHVKGNPEHTKSLGRETLAAMKQRLTRTLENSNSIVDEIFTRDSFWVHVNYEVKANGDRFGQAYNNKKLAEDNIRNGIKTALGEVGKILIDYKYLTLGREYQWEKGMRYDYTRANNGESRLMYAYGVSLPSDLTKLITEYCNGIDQLHKLSCQLIDSQASLSQQEALDLWNDV